MLNIFSKKKKINTPDYYKVVEDLQNATKESYNAYEEVDNKLKKIERLYEEKSKDLQLFKGLSNISLELLSTSHDFEKNIQNCLKILSNTTGYECCIIYTNDVNNDNANVLFEHFKQTPIKNTILSYLDFNKYPSWAIKLQRQEVIFEQDLKLLDESFKDETIEQLCISPIFIEEQWWGCLLLTSSKKICSTPNKIEAIITVSNMFSESIRKNSLLKDRVSVEDRFHDFSSYLLDNMDGVAFWMKDYKDRYLFLNDKLIEILFPGKTKEECLGKTNPEIFSKSEPEQMCFDNINKVSDLPNLKLKKKDSEYICNLTDQLTRYFEKPCKYFEIIDKYALEIWKTPIFRNNDNKNYCCAGTVGALIDVTTQKDKKIQYIKHLEQTGKAYRISDTDHYYLVQIDSPTIFLE